MYKNHFIVSLFIIGYAQILRFNPLELWININSCIAMFIMYFNQSYFDKFKPIVLLNFLNRIIIFLSFCQDKSSLNLMLLTRAHHATYSFISNNSKKNSDKWAQKIGCDKKNQILWFHPCIRKKQFQNVSVLFALILMYGMIHELLYQFFQYQLITLTRMV